MGRAAQVRKVKFCIGFYLGMTQAAAARAAGYKGKQKSLEQIGSRLVNHDSFVKAELARLKAQDEKTAFEVRHELVESLMAQIHSEWTRYLRIDRKGKLHLDIKRMLGDGKTHLLQYYKRTPNGFSYKPPSLHKTCDRISKIMGFYR